MNFALSEDHLVLRDSARAFLDKEINLAPLLIPGASVADAGYAATWTKMADLGWAGLIVPEVYDGLGLTPVDLMMVVSEIGRVLAPCPMLGVLAGAWSLIRGGSEAQRARLLPAVAAGQQKMALAICDSDGNADGPGSDVRAQPHNDRYQLSGSKAFVIDAGHADTLVVVAEERGQRAWYLVKADQPGVAVEVLNWRDLTREVCAVRFNNAEAELMPTPDTELWPYVRDRLLLLLAAESAAGLRETLDATVSYAKERVAFGRPIGSYQAIKHTLADMFGACECADAAVLYAAWALTDEPARASEAAAMAKAYATEAFVEATHRSIQVFGAIGFTWEMKNHLYFKRARANAELFGSPSAQRARVVDILRQRAA